NGCRQRVAVLEARGYPAKERLKSVDRGLALSTVMRQRQLLTLPGSVKGSNSRNGERVEAIPPAVVKNIQIRMTGQRGQIMIHFLVSKRQIIFYQAVVIPYIDVLQPSILGRDDTGQRLEVSNRT